MTQKNRTRDMTVGAPMKLILSFAAPLLFGFLFQQFYSFVDTAIVGKYLGAEKLAAVGGTGSINFLVLGFCQGACSGFAIPIAQAFGARDEHRVRKCVAASAYLSAGVSIVMAVMTGLMCPAMLRLMNTPEEIINDSVAYIRIIFLGIPVTILYNMASGVLRSLGDSRTPVVFLILASLINVVLDLVLIIYVGMGVVGAAVATLISQLVSGVGCIIVMKKQFPILRMNSEELRPDGALMKSLLLTGLPMGLQFSITAVGSVIVQWSVNGLGVESVAAVAAGGKLSMGPVWDFDIAFGNTTYNDNDKEEGFWLMKAAWFDRLMKEKAFVDRVKARFAEFYAAQPQWYDYLDHYAAYLTPYIQLNEERWKTMNVTLWSNPYVFPTYEDYMKELHRWLKTRMDWMKTEIDKIPS